MDSQPHRLIHARIGDPGAIHAVWPGDMPNAHRLNPGTPNSNRQRFGDELTLAHRFVLIPSVLSRHNWNVIFDTGAAGGGFGDVQSERFALDPRLQAQTLGRCRRAAL